MNRPDVSSISRYAISTAGAAEYHSVIHAPSRIDAVGVVIPAQNRADTIEKCIFSIFAANHCSGWHNSLWIVVVADGCTDDTAKVARRVVGAFGEVLEVATRSLPVAFRIGACTAIEHFQQKPRHHLLLVNAPADRAVGREWLDMELQSRNSAVARAPA
jgi:hypothetical protein